MKSSLRTKLDQLAQRREEINALLSDPSTIEQQNRFRELSIELADIGPLTDAYDGYCALTLERANTEAMAKDSDPSIRAMALEELTLIEHQLNHHQDKLQKLLIPKDPNDERNIFLEIRAGTGGDEAALFAGDLFRMYQHFAESQKWEVSVLSRSHGEHGGYKEIISRIDGRGAYSKLKFESGAHRVQRVPETETQGRIHTSACTIAVLPEADELDEIEVKSSEMRIDTFRASGAGGQHVNKTDSAVRITHLPSGIVVECQDERSQHKNKARALSVLNARLLAAELSKQQQDEAQTRRTLVGSGDRSERIRTYNFSQGRVTDHRIGLTLYKLDEILAGNLAQVIEPLTAEQQANQLTDISVL